eukprot:scaffold146632_cov60-Attheya_sp.AAC.1
MFQKAQAARRQAAKEEKEKARAKHRQRQAEYLSSDSSTDSDNDSEKSVPDKDNAYNTAREPQKESMGSFVSKTHTIEAIKDLHRLCHFYDTEHMFMLPMTWLKVQRTFPNEEVRSEITDYFLQAILTNLVFFVEDHFKDWNPKIHGPRTCLQSFYIAALAFQSGNLTDYPMANVRNGVTKETRSSTNDGNESSASKLFSSSSASSSNDKDQST